MHINISKTGAKRTVPDSFQWCPATRQEKWPNLKWNMKFHLNTREKLFTLSGAEHGNSSWPGEPWSLPLCRRSKPTLTRSCVSCSGWCPCLGRGSDGVISRGSLQPSHCCHSRGVRIPDPPPHGEMAPAGGAGAAAGPRSARGGREGGWREPAAPLSAPSLLSPPPRCSLRPSARPW